MKILWIIAGLLAISGLAQATNYEIVWVTLVPSVYHENGTQINWSASVESVNVPNNANTTHGSGTLHWTGWGIDGNGKTRSFQFQQMLSAPAGSGDSFGTAYYNMTVPDPQIWKAITGCAWTNNNNTPNALDNTVWHGCATVTYPIYAGYEWETVAHAFATYCLRSSDADLGCVGNHWANETFLTDVDLSSYCIRDNGLENPLDNSYCPTRGFVDSKLSSIGAYSNNTFEGKIHANNTWEGQVHANATWEGQVHANATWCPLSCSGGNSSNSFESWFNNSWIHDAFFGNITADHATFGTLSVTGNSNMTNLTVTTVTGEVIDTSAISRDIATTALMLCLFVVIVWLSYMKSGAFPWPNFVAVALALFTGMLLLRAEPELVTNMFLPMLVVNIGVLLFAIFRMYNMFFPDSNGEGGTTDMV